MQSDQEKLVDPDPFILAAICLQAAAVVLQFVQISQGRFKSEASKAIQEHRPIIMGHLEGAIEELERAITNAERIIRRSSESPKKEFYESSFKISFGIMNFSTKNSQEYSSALVDANQRLTSMMTWVGQIISQDTQLAAELGVDLSNVVDGASDRLNAIMANGGAIEAVLAEAKLVLSSCKTAISRRLDPREN